LVRKADYEFPEGWQEQENRIWEREMYAVPDNAEIDEAWEEFVRDNPELGRGDT
jgi:hypothetical protein